jgi:F0F1-type ATP synthase membrane subunit b/b'
MWLETLLSDPVFIFAVCVFVFVLAYFAWQERKHKEQALEERIRELENKLDEKNKNEKA